jgi:NADH dehydrogenase/NADH:ubiquinone oxidoreductase subunit G
MDEWKMNDKTIHILMDGRRIEASPDETLLTVAGRADIHIPTLCFHEALEQVGSCRLCLVEITRKSHPDKKEIVTSCEFPAEDGLVVETRSEAVRRQRQTILSLLAARCPEVVLLKKLADDEGGLLDYRRFEGSDNCIMCTLCTRTCAELGIEAITAVGRGSHKEIAPPFHGAAELCIGCGACHRICPTKCIEMKDTKDTRSIWGREFRFLHCETCGAPTVTEDTAAFSQAKHKLDMTYYTTCATCKKNQIASKFLSISEPFRTGA